MLRVMKRKLRQDEPAAEPLRCSAMEPGITKDSTTPRAQDSSSQSRIVSHVPLSTKESVSSLGSSDSTISSTQYHPFQSLTRKHDDETHDGQPPVLPARVSVCGPGLRASESSSEHSKEGPKPLPESVVMHIPQQRGFARSISFLSGDLVDREAKRPRIEPVACRPANTPSQRPARLLLATTKDGPVLSPLHIFVRRQIEVFEATEEDLKQPAPGRRIPIQLNQVGLRCIHCKHQKARERKKRAVCYPSSVGRVYHSVSDMKFAHFPCAQMPKDLQQRFLELKDESQLQSKLCKEPGSKRTGGANASTAQYYHDSARELGMVDGKGGIFATPGLASGSTSVLASAVEKGRLPGPLPCLQPDPSITLAAIQQANALQGILFGNFLPSFAYAKAAAASRAQGSAALTLNEAQALVTAGAAAAAVTKPSLAVVPSVHEGTEKAMVQEKPSQPSGGAKALLASEDDKQYLTPIHCFVRRHVEVFAANEQDLAAPAPGRKKSIVLGQVGLRCVHCARLPVKERVKRAICFPPAASGIYHAVSNMKFDHFKHCKGMPEEVRKEFQELVSAPSSSSSAGGKKESSRPRVSNSTAQYYHDSALLMGLVDTPEGIRFHQVAAVKEQGEDFPEGMEALIIAATDPKVRAEHEKRRSSPLSV